MAAACGDTAEDPPATDGNSPPAQNAPGGKADSPHGQPQGFSCPDGRRVASEWRAGAGMYEVTGPAADLGLMGYAKPDQIAKGIHLRLWARAFVITSTCDDRSAALVTVDLQSVSIAVREAVLEALASAGASELSRDNVLLAATHTHSGPGGYAKHVLYDVSVGGFNRQNFDAIVDGISKAVLRARDAQEDARLAFARGRLRDVTINRSREAYLQNPAAERSAYPTDVDDVMTLLRIDSLAGAPIGVMTWFGVHPTSMSNANHLVSGDNKGLAAHLFERAMWDKHGGDPRTPGAFVAAFANGALGDVSPLRQTDPESGEAIIARTEDFADTWRLAQAQYERALTLYDEAEPTSGGLASVHRYVRMDDRKLGDGEQTCAAAIGVSMLAGAEDGPGVGSEGVTCENPGTQLIPYDCTPCQAEKPIVAGISPGQTLTGPWTPPVLPFQLIRLGTHTLVAAPFEVTTMSGNRIRKAVAEELGAGAERVVLTSPANGYSGYCATRQEYAAQHYEGASTHFGPRQLEATQDIYRALAHGLETAAPDLVDVAPVYEHDPLIETNVNHQFDGKPVNVNAFGEVVSGYEPKPSYAAGDVVSVRFWGAHLARNLRRDGESFLVIERKNSAGGFETVHQDWDWETRLFWERDKCLSGGGLCSQIWVDWQVTDTTPPGTYRIRHNGSWRSAWDGKVTDFSGATRELEVQ